VHTAGSVHYDIAQNFKIIYVYSSTFVKVIVIFHQKTQTLRHCCPRVSVTWLIEYCHIENFGFPEGLLILKNVESQILLGEFC